MASPDNSSPPRPRSVPADARWDPRAATFEWVVGPIDAEGRRHGTYRSWTRHGVLHGECGYAHGRAHGTNISYHPDGTIATEADWVNGVVMNSVFHRSEAPTTEPFAACAPGVWSVRYYTRDGKTNYTIRYFVRDGTECGPDANPLPVRPAAVSADARWFPEIERWVDGEIERGTNTRVGRWRQWSVEGVLRNEELRDATGVPSLIAHYSAAGILERETVRAPGGEQHDHYAGGSLTTRTRTDARGRSIYKASWTKGGEIEHEQTRTFDGEHLATVVEHGAGGVRSFEARRDGATLVCVLYGPDGTSVDASGQIAGGKLVGRWQLFADGRRRRELDLTDLALDQEPTSEGLAWTLGEALFRADEPSFVTPPPLDGIDDEPWAETTGAFDHDVEQFPRLVRGLCSTDPQVRAFALDVIHGEIVQPGMTYPATARVIPHLARLLAHDTTDRASLLRTIEAAAEAAVLARASRANGTIDAIAAAWPDVFACFATGSTDDRRRIFQIARLAPAAKVDLLGVAQHDPDPTMRACAIDTLPALVGYAATDLVPLLSDRDLLIRTTTAFAIARTSGPEAPRETVHALTDALRNWRDIAARFATMPTSDRHVLAAIAHAAGSIHSPDARSLARELCAALDEVDGRSAITFGDGLLSLAFGRGERPFAKRFVEILDTLARSTKFWQVDAAGRGQAPAVDPCVFAILARWNLPRTQHDLAALVTELRITTDPEGRIHDHLRPRPTT